MASTGARSRRKGRAWEQELVHHFRRVWPSAKRGIGQARLGSEVCDVEGTPWWVEAKVGGRTNPRAAIRQAEAATDGRQVVAVCKDNQTKPGRSAEVWVTLRLDAFLSLSAAAEGRPLAGLAEVQSAAGRPITENGEPGTSNPPANAKTSTT
jgi:hypothetical protein